MTVGVYVLIGADDRPIYIGKSICVEKRVRQHHLDPTRHERLGGKTKGEATHRVEVIECAREELDAAEKRVIAERGPVLNVLDSMTDYAVHRRNAIRENQRRPRPNPVVPLEYRASPGFAEAVQKSCWRPRRPNPSHRGFGASVYAESKGQTGRAAG